MGESLEGNPKTKEIDTNSFVIFFSFFRIILVKKTSLDFVFDNLLGVSEGLLEVFVKHIETLGSLCFLSPSSFAEFLGESLLASINSGCSCLCLKLSGSLAEWIELLHHGFIFEWVLLGLIM